MVGGGGEDQSISEKSEPQISEPAGTCCVTPGSLPLHRPGNKSSGNDLSTALIIANIVTITVTNMYRVFMCQALWFIDINHLVLTNI